MMMAALRAVATPADLSASIAAINGAAIETKDVVVESDAFVDSIVLGTVSRTHIYVSGEGGVGKTFGAEVWSNHLGVETFYAQFRADTKREEIFGPLSMKALQDDRYEHKTQGYLSEANIAVLDEFKDAGRFTRQLLNILNERWFVNGGVRVQCDLHSAIGATNFWIEEQELAALFDRFAQRIVQEPIRTSEGFKKVLRGQLDRGTGTANTPLTVVTHDQLAAVHAAVDVCRVSDDMLNIVDKLRKDALSEKLSMSPRRWGEGLKLARAAAVLAGRDEVIEDDLRPFARVLPNHPDDFKTARDLCKAFRDKYTEAVEQARDALNEQLSQLSAQRDAAAAGQPVDMGVLTAVNRSLKEVRKRVQASLDANQGRDSTPFDRLTSEIADAEQFIHKQVLGG